MTDKKSYRSSFILLTILFFLWGFITVLVDSLIPRLRELFTLTYFQAGLVQFAFFGVYFLLSIPASFILSKNGYKKGIITTFNEKNIDDFQKVFKILLKEGGKDLVGNSTFLDDSIFWQYDF